MLHYFHNLTFATFATFATLTFSIHLRISEKSCTFAAQFGGICFRFSPTCSRHGGINRDKQVFPTCSRHGGINRDKQVAGEDACAPGQVSVPNAQIIVLEGAPYFDISSTEIRAKASVNDR